MNLEQIKRGERAKELTKDPLIVEYWNNILQELTREFLTCKVEDVEKLQELLRKRDAIKKMQEHFTKEINRGIMALKHAEKEAAKETK